jgi:uncharacterized membrane protein
MSAADVAQTIQLIIAPVVLITACALIQNAILGRYASVGQYMRSLTLERLNLLRSNDDMFYLERLQEIDRQIPLLIQRHRLLQNTVLIIYGAIVIFLVNMFAIALAVALDTGAIATFALLLFLGGTGTLLTGVCSTALEVRMSHRAICYETNQISRLMKVL